MNTRTKILSGAMLIYSCFTTPALAKDLIIELLNGTAFTCTIPSEGLTLKFNDGKIWVADKSFAFTDVDRFYATNSVNVNTITQPLLHINLINNQTLRVSNIVESAAIELYSANGMKYPVTSHTNNKYADIDIKTLPVGSYILKIGNQTVKWQKR